MNKIIIANQKGGSAKTTTAIHLSAALALRGRRVLAVDLDPQGHLAEGLGFRALDLPRHIAQVLDYEVPLSDVVVNARDGLDLAPSNIHLAHLEAALFTKHRREDRLRYALADLSDDYDYVIIDCPPSLGLLTINGLSAADAVLIPMVTEYYSMLGVGLLLNTIQQLRREINPELQLLGLLPTRYTRTNNSREVLERTHDDLGSTIHIFDTPIPETVRFREAAALGLTLFEHDGDNPAAAAYMELAQEVDSHGT